MTCPHCKGTKIEPDQIPVKDPETGVLDEKPCTRCDGEGEVPNEFDAPVEGCIHGVSWEEACFQHPCCRVSTTIDEAALYSEFVDLPIRALQQAGFHRINERPKIDAAVWYHPKHWTGVEGFAMVPWDYWIGNHRFWAKTREALNWIEQNPVFMRRAS